MKSNPEQLVRDIKRCMKHYLVPMIHGFSGIGKSDIVHQVAQELNFKLIDWRGSTADPVDLSGFPVLTGTKATYLPFDTFPISTDKVPKGYNGWLLFADELPNAPVSVQKAMYKLILDRMVGNSDLHPNVFIVAAGNLATEGAMVNAMPTPLQSRMVHFELQVSVPAWLKWATTHDIDYRMISFIQYKPHLLHTFKLGHTDFTYACPRTIADSSKITKGLPVTQADLAILAGTISEGVAREYIGYTKVFGSLPHISEIAANPLSTVVPTEPSTRWATAAHVAEYMTTKNADILMDYVVRLPLENQVIAVNLAVGKNKKLMLVDKIDDWLNKNAQR